MELKKNLLTVLAGAAILLTPLTGFAQDDEDTPELTLFRGGELTLDLDLNFNFLGQGSGASMMGGVISTRADQGGSAVIYNPALLANSKERSLNFSGKFGYGSWTVGSVQDEFITSLNDEIETQTSDVLTDPDNFQLTPDARLIYTKVTGLDAGVASQLGNISIAWPVHDRVVLGLATSNPSAFNLRLGATGISTKIAGEQGSDDVSLRFDVLMNISLLAELSFTMNKTSLGAGVNVYDGEYGKANVGFSYHQYALRNTRKFDADLSGMVVVGNADERFFNNPQDVNLNREIGDTNEFLLSARGDFRDTSTGFQIGASYELPRYLAVNFVYEQAPTFELQDPNAASTAFLPIFVIGDDILSGDLDISLDTLQANKPNLTTERDVSQLVSSATLQLPSSFTAGLDAYLGPHTLSLNYTSYLDDLVLRYGGSTYGKKATSGIGFGLDFQFSDKLRPRSAFLLPVRLLFLDFDGILFQALGGLTRYSDPHYMIGGRVMLGDGYVLGNGDQELVDTLGLPVPLGFSLGRKYTIFDNVEVGMVVTGVPDLLFRYSVGFKF